MLWHPEDAQATQEILLRIVTHLATFRRESSFYTWVYRIAANHLLRWRLSVVGVDLQCLVCLFDRVTVLACQEILVRESKVIHW